MKKYLIVVEETGTGFSAFSPDLPGCVATGGTRDKVEKTMRGRLAEGNNRPSASRNRFLTGREISDVTGNEFAPGIV